MDRQTDSGVRILIACHASGPVPEGPHLLPIHVGRAGAKAPLPGMIGDDTGENISAMNPEYCELTAHYWAWKNFADSRPVGLMHYRRLFDFAGRLNGQGHAERFVRHFDQQAWHADVEARFAGATEPMLILPRPVRLSLPLGLHYRTFHHGDDLATLRAVVAEYYPGFLPDLDRALRGRLFLMGNMFVMSRPVLDHYSALLFDVLARTRARRGERQDSGYQRRWLGFLAERVMTAYAFGQYRRLAFPRLEPEFCGIVNIDPAAPLRAGPLRLVRYCLQGRITLSRAFQGLRGIG